MTDNNFNDMDNLDTVKEGSSGEIDNREAVTEVVQEETVSEVSATDTADNMNTADTTDTEATVNTTDAALQGQDGDAQRYDKYIVHDESAPAQGWYPGNGYPAQTPGSIGYSQQGYAGYFIPSQGGYGFAPAPEQVKPVKEKKHHVRKVLLGLLMGLLAGVLAGVGFVGSNYLFQKFFPETEKDYGIANVITGENSTSEKADAIQISDAADRINSSTTDVSQIVGEVAPAIVQINCKFPAQSYFGTYEQEGAGSGIIIKRTEKELLIATNNHVVDEASSITITFNDDTKAEAAIKGSDSLADLAVVAVDISKLDQSQLDNIVVAKLGSSDDVRVGQMAIAIGNAMGYGQSTTVGYISAKDREVTIDGVKMVLLQTDAAINPGNSGGALINISGEVIGINSVKFASNTIEGMGFAIPISRAQKILDELGNREVLKDEEKGYLDITIQTVTESVSAAYNWPLGIYVAKVNEGGAADKAGIETGDIIVEVNGISVKTVADLKASITSHRVGTQVTVKAQRLEGGFFVEKEFDVVLGMDPQYMEKPEEDGESDDGGSDEDSESEDEQTEDTTGDGADTDGLRPEDNPVTLDPKEGFPVDPGQGNNQNPGQQVPGYFDPFEDFEDFFGFGLW